MRVGRAARAAQDALPPRRARETRAHSLPPAARPPAVPPAHHKVASTVPAVPRQSELPRRPRAGAARKDFVSENAINAITMRPPPEKRAPPPPVDWLKREGIGAVPEYLGKVRDEIEAEREYILQLLDADALRAEAEAGGSTRELGDDERADLLDALKAKWSAVNKAYQTYSHMKISTATSSLGQVNRKQTAEALLDALDKDIRRLSAPHPIYVKSSV